MEALGRYRIQGEIGRGGGGVVYKAQDPQTGKTVAIKTVPLSSNLSAAEHELLTQRLKREAASAASLRHPNIVEVYEFAEEATTSYFVMEYVEGETLDRVAKQEGGLSREKMLSILKQTADALDFAHNGGIIHRDIKPPNIMVMADGTVKITDFGTAKVLQGQHSTQLTVAGTMLGSPHYMSPEQVTESGVDGRSDQFSLAVIAYELLAGRKPFQGDFAPAVLYQIVSEPAPPVHQVKPDLPPSLDPVLQRALGKTRLERYPSCAAFVAEIAQSLAAAPVEALAAAVQQENAAEAPATPEAMVASSRSPESQNGESSPSRQPRRGFFSRLFGSKR